MNACVLLFCCCSHLLDLFSEIEYWSRLKYDIPPSVNDIYPRREELRGLREGALLLIRNYNRIIGMLSPDEYGLFRERIRMTDKKLNPGLTKLLWSSMGSSKVFIRDGLVHVDEVALFSHHICIKGHNPGSLIDCGLLLQLQMIVDEYKAHNVTIAGLCHEISETLLIHLDGKTVYR